MKFKTWRDKKTVMSTKITRVFRSEIGAIAEREGVKPSNVFLTFAIEGYKQYCLEKGLSSPDCNELNDDEDQL